MHSFDRGVIYTAIGEDYIREAQLSARSVRTSLPDTCIVLFTDSPLEDKNAFDDVIRLENLNRRPQLDKLACIKNSPFANTLFLDTDTYLCGSPSELFDLAGKFDIAMALDRHYYDFFPEDTAVPGAFCEFNQGSWCSGTRRRCRRWFRPRWIGRRISTAETGIPIGD